VLGRQGAMKPVGRDRRERIGHSFRKVKSDNVISRMSLMAIRPGRCGSSDALTAGSPP
jgi:hypothetical protein